MTQEPTERPISRPPIPIRLAVIALAIVALAWAGLLISAGVEALISGEPLDGQGGTDRLSNLSVVYGIGMIVGALWLFRYAFTGRTMRRVK